MVVAGREPGVGCWLSGACPSGSSAEVPATAVVAGGRPVAAAWALDAPGGSATGVRDVRRTAGDAPPPSVQAAGVMKLGGLPRRTTSASPPH